MIDLVLVSSCLAGVKCKYNGGDNKLNEIDTLVESGRAILLCPEVLGGLPIPRPPCEIVTNGRECKAIVDSEGGDFTEEFMTGAQKTLEIVKLLGIKSAILQPRSPSCGFGEIYDGTFSGKMIEGNGVTAELLSQNGVKVYNDKNFDEFDI